MKNLNQQASEKRSAIHGVQGEINRYLLSSGLGFSAAAALPDAPITLEGASENHPLVQRLESVRTAAKKSQGEIEALRFAMGGLRKALDAIEEATDAGPGGMFF